MFRYLYSLIIAQFGVVASLRLLAVKEPGSIIVGDFQCETRFQ